jgi:hypothetical protein
MTRPHKTVEYDLDTVLSKENESSPTIMSETETKPSLTVTSETGNGHRASQLSPQVKQHTIGKEPVKVTAWSPSRLVADPPRAMATTVRPGSPTRLQAREDHLRWQPFIRHGTVYKLMEKPMIQIDRRTNNSEFL